MLATRGPEIHLKALPGASADGCDSDDRRDDDRRSVGPRGGDLSTLGHNNGSHTHHVLSPWCSGHVAATVEVAVILPLCGRSTASHPLPGASLAFVAARCRNSRIGNALCLTSVRHGTALSNALWLTHGTALRIRLRLSSGWGTALDGGRSSLCRRRRRISRSTRRPVASCSASSGIGVMWQRPDLQLEALHSALPRVAVELVSACPDRRLEVAHSALASELLTAPGPSHHARHETGREDQSGRQQVSVGHHDSAGGRAVGNRLRRHAGHPVAGRVQELGLQNDAFGGLGRPVGREGPADLKG
mmetsp:Transcript_19998/g.46699  ORF Transcript_19998/g.46699 Transcript_19998/m.46699 type:complete len:303 (-) Transcript_19998:10090-10998(-)